MSKKAKVVVAYLRLSREDGNDESTSISNQRRIILEYAEKNNMKIEKFYIDDGESGFSFSKRPAFNELKEDLNANKIDTIIVKDLSRLGRNSGHMLTFVENLQKDDKRLIAIGDNYDSDDENSSDMLNINSWLGERYLKEISRKVKDSIRAMQKEGKFISCVPYGYVIDPIVKGQYHIDEVAAIYVRRIFDMYINGMGTRRIALALTEEGVPTHSILTKQRLESMGRPYRGTVSNIWHDNTIQNILKNTFYIGTLTLGKTRRRSIRGKKVKLDKEEHLVFKNAHEPIIDKTTFNIVQEIMADRSINAYRGKKVDRNSPYSGMLICADCGKKLTPTTSSGKTRFICNTYNKKGVKFCKSHSILEENITESLILFLDHCRENLDKTIDNFDSIIREEYKKRGSNTGSITRVEKSLSDAKAALKYIMEKKMIESIANPSMAELIHDTYDMMQREKLNEIKSLETQLNDLVDNTIDEINIKDNLLTARNIFDHIIATKKLTKKQVATIIKHIVVYEDQGLDIVLKGDLYKSCSRQIIHKKGTENRLFEALIDYMFEHKDKFIGSRAFEYISVEKGFAIGTRKFYDQIHKFEELKIIEHIGLRKGYRVLVGSKKEAINAFVNNTIANSTTWWSYNNDIIETITFEDIMKINKWIENDINNTSRKLY